MLCYASLNHSFLSCALLACLAGVSFAPFTSDIVNRQILTLWYSRIDPRVDANPVTNTMDYSSNVPDRTVGSEASSEQKTHHLGRDTAAAGAVGGAAYEAEKHHRKNETNEPNTTANPSHPTTTGQSTASSMAAPTGVNYPIPESSGPRDQIHSRDAATSVTAPTGVNYPTPENNSREDHHYGRDAAIAGGVGGAAYEAEKHHKHDKDLTQAERDAKKEHKHEVKEAKKEHKHEAKEEKKEHKHEAKEEKKEHKDSKGGLFSFLREYHRVSPPWYVC